VIALSTSAITFAPPTDAAQTSFERTLGFL